MHITTVDFKSISQDVIEVMSLIQGFWVFFKKSKELPSLGIKLIFTYSPLFLVTQK